MCTDNMCIDFLQYNSYLIDAGNAFGSCSEAPMRDSIFSSCYEILFRIKFYICMQLCSTIYLLLSH